MAADQSEAGWKMMQEERIRALEQMVAELMAERVPKPEAAAPAEGAKRRGPKPLAERTPEQQAAHAAAKAARAAAKASGSSSASSVSGASDTEGAPKKGPKAAAKAAAAASAPEKPPKGQSEGQKAWMALVSDTMRHMGANGWAPWTDIKTGLLWPASAQNPQGQHVYSEGAHMGKTPSQQRGGMSRASYLKSRVVGLQGLQGGWAEMEGEVEKE